MKQREYVKLRESVKNAKQEQMGSSLGLMQAELPYSTRCSRAATSVVSECLDLAEI